MRNSKVQILKLLHESDLSLTPANIAYNIDLSKAYVQRECKELWNTEMVDRDAEESRPFYSVRERGRLALEHDTLDIEYTYQGQYSDGRGEITVQPAEKPLSEWGDAYHDSSSVSWGDQGEDAGAFNLAQDLLRHAVDDAAADEYVFDFYQNITSHLPATFRLTETQIRAWVANQKIEETDPNEDSPDIDEELRENLPKRLKSLRGELTK